MIDYIKNRLEKDKDILNSISNAVGKCLYYFFKTGIVLTTMIVKAAVFILMAAFGNIFLIFGIGGDKK